MPGKPFEGTEEETMQTIRQILTAEFEAEDNASRSAHKDVAAPQDRDPSAPRAFVERTLGKAPRRRANDFPEIAKDAPEPAKKRASAVSRLVPKALGLAPATIGQVTQFRPTTRHLAIVSTLLLVVVRPHWFVIAICLMLSVVIGTFLLLGSERIWTAVLARLTKIEEKDPARGAVWRARLDNFAYRWDGFLDLFPDGMVDELYMPDFQSMAMDEEQYANAMADRLDRMVREG